MLEIGGPVVIGIGAAYERTLPLSRLNRVTLRGGFGGVDSFTKMSSHLGLSYVFGRSSGAEIGTSYLMNYDAGQFDMDDEEDDNFDNGMQLIIGYRYQNLKNGLLFRIYWVAPVGCCGTYIPIYSGLSFGYAF